MSDFVSGHRSLIYGESPGERLREALRSTPWWAISILIHLAILIFAYTYTWEVALPPPEESRTHGRTGTRRLSPLQALVRRHLAARALLHLVAGALNLAVVLIRKGGLVLTRGLEDLRVAHFFSSLTGGVG